MSTFQYLAHQLAPIFYLPKFIQAQKNVTEGLVSPFVSDM